MTELGPVLSTHRGRLAAGGLLWLLGPLAVVGGVIALVRGLVTGEASGILTGLGGLALGGLAGAALLLYSVALWRQELVAHQHGFVWRRPLRAPLVVRWDQIRGVRTKTTVGGRGTFHLKGQEVELELTLVGGRELVVSNDLERVEELRGYASTPSGPHAPSPWAPSPSGRWGGER